MVAELFFRSDTVTGPVIAWSVDVETEPTFSAGTPTPLITGPYGVELHNGRT